MTIQEQIKKYVKSTLHQEIMNIIVDLIPKLDKEIDIDEIKHHTKDKYNDVDIFISLQQLCLISTPVLEVFYEYEDGTKLTKIDINQYRRTEYEDQLILTDKNYKRKYHIYKHQTIGILEPFKILLWFEYTGVKL